MKRVGILSFFPAFNPPRSGGELRLHYMAKALASREFDVQLASPTYHDAPKECIHHFDGFREYRFPKVPIYNKTHALLDRIAGFQECSGLVCALVSRYHQDLKEKAEELAKSSDILAHESPFLAPLTPRRRKRKQLLVYNSYNVETLMARDMFGTSIQGRLATRWIRRAEKQLLHESDIVLACSPEDREIFVRQFNVPFTKIEIIPNGVDIHHIKPAASSEQRLLAREKLGVNGTRPVCFFIGSYHPPNIEAVDFIIQQLAIHFPEAHFLIAGKVNKAFEDRDIPDNVRMMGLIEEEDKQALLHGADVALNPMLSGSGTNLKMLDFLAAGLPILSTPHGARGLQVENRYQAIVAEPDEFRESLSELLGDQTLRDILREEARNHAVDNFSWDTIGEKVADLYEIKSKKRLIILNDYRVMPAEQGGQVRVQAVAEHLAAHKVGVTILTLSADGISRRLQINENLEELNIPRSRTHRVVDAFLAQLVGCSADDVSALLFTPWLSREYKRVLKQELKTAQGVMFSHPYMNCMRKYIPGRITRYYDSHNTEYLLKTALFRGGPLSRFLIGRVRKAEIQCSNDAQAVFCVSDENRKQLESICKGMQKRSFICPNGVSCKSFTRLTLEEKRRYRKDVGFGREYVAVFLGSGHPPNREAADLIIEKIAREHPRVLFLLVGSVSGWYWNRHLPGNVLLMGMVSKDVKDFILQTSDFALNPMMTGSGTSLKLFDYMAAGLPVLSTPTGARGLDEEELKSIRILKPEEFSKGLRNLLSDPNSCRELSENSRKTAERHFDWSVTLQEMVRIIRSERK